MTTGEEFKKLMQRLGCAYLVGGSVRNSLLGLPVSDADIASGLLPEEVLKLCEGEYEARIVNPRLGTVLINCGAEGVEHTTFRSESYGRGHTPEETVLGVSMERDALRRDFSVNALYQNPMTGEISDPTGRGLADIERRTLCTTTQNPADIIADDGLRLLRMCRFAGELGFDVDEELLRCAEQNAHIIEDISAERIFAEMCKILMCDEKYAHAGGLRRAMNVFFRVGLQKYILGEGPSEMAKKLLFDAPAELTLRWAAMLYDMDAASVLGKLRAPTALIKGVSGILLAKDEELCTGIVKFGGENMINHARLTKDEQSIETIEKKRAEGCPFTLRELDITGEDILKLGILPVCVGDVLKRLLGECLNMTLRNERDALLARAKELQHGI